MRNLIWRVKVNYGVLRTGFWLAVAKIAGSIQRFALRKGTEVICERLRLIDREGEYADVLSEIDELLD